MVISRGQYGKCSVGGDVTVCVLEMEVAEERACLSVC